MKKHHFFLLAFACCLFQFASGQTPNHVVISQVYGAGGNTSAQYKTDFVELYNPTGNTVDLTGWSLQYAAATGNFSSANKLDLSGSIGAGKYFLVQVGNAGANGAALPVPDTSATFSMSFNSGKIALVSNTLVLPATLSCPPTGNGIVDFVGYGTANCFEGTKGTPVLNNNTAAHRKNNGCTDTDDNNVDFFELAPSPRNSVAPAHSCGTVIFISNIAPVPLCVNAGSGATATVTYSITGTVPSSLRFYLSDSTGSFGNKVAVGNTPVSGANGTISIGVPPALKNGTQYRLRADAADAYGEVSIAFEIINGAKNIVSVNAHPDQTEASVQWKSPSGCFEEFMVVCKQGSSISGTPSGDGSAYTADANFTGAGTAFGGGKVVYKGKDTSALVTGLTLGQTYYFKVYTHRGNDWSSGLEASATTRVIPAPGEVLINGFSPKYNAASDEYIELVNTTGSTFNLSDFNLLYQNSAGSARVPQTFTGTLQPHSFLLLAPATQPSVNVGKTINLPRDHNSGSALADNGQIALVRLKDGVALDAVGWGALTGGTYFEGSTLPSLNGSPGGYRRKIDGLDHNNNAADFEIISVANIDLRNSASRLANAGAQIPAGTYSRLYVTGNSALTDSSTLTEKLVLSGGKLALGNADLTVSAAEGGSANSYVQTNGSGVLAVKAVSLGNYPFPIGNSTYNPLIIANGSGLQWRVRIEDAVSAFGGDRAVRRTWHITPSAKPSSGANLLFQYNEGDAAQLGENFSASDGVQVWQFHNDAWRKAGPVVLPDGPARGVRTVTLSGWSTFSPFVIASASAVLPVRFGAMQLYEREHHRVLAFTAHNELDIERYDVEWSGDGSRFIVIGTLQPRNNRGGTETYRFEDHRPLWNTSYYRVRAYEKGGGLLYSPVLTAPGRNGMPVLRVYPSPVTGGAINYNIGNLPAGSYTIQILNAAGAQVWTQQLQHGGGMTAGAVSLPLLQRGVYLLTVYGPVRMHQAFIVH